MHLQRVASLAYRHLEQRHASRAKQPRRAHFGDHAGHLSGAQLADAPRIQPVFIAKRQVVQQVLDRRDALLQQHLGNARPNALHILHVGREIQHSAMVNQWLTILICHHELAPAGEGSAVSYVVILSGVSVANGVEGPAFRSYHERSGCPSFPSLGKGWYPITFTPCHPERGRAVFLLDPHLLRVRRARSRRHPLITRMSHG